MASHLAALPFASAPLVDDGLRHEWRLAAFVAALFFAGFLGWAMLTPLDAAAYARGIVEVAGNRQAVQHESGGIVSALYVSEGDAVVKAQPLLQVSGSNVVAEERSLTSEYIMLVAQRARLVAERDGRADIAAPAEFARLGLADGALADEALAAQTSLLAARRASLSAEKTILAKRSQQANAEIGGIGSMLSSNREQRRLIGEELEGMQALAAKGFASQTRVRQLERAAAALDGNHGESAAQVARVRELISENAARAVALDRESREGSDDLLRETLLRLNELTPRLTAARDKLQRSVVRAPASGRIVNLAVFTVGGVAAPGATLMEIVPQDRQLVVKAQISPDDIDDVRVGMRSKVRFPTIRDSNLAPVDGTLVTLSADSLVDERSGARFFTGEVRVPAQAFDRIARLRGGRPSVRPGLPAEVLIPLERRTLFAYLVEPITRSMWLSGREH